MRSTRRTRQTSAEIVPPAQAVPVDSVLDATIDVLRERIDEAGATIARSGPLLCVRCYAPQLVQVAVEDNGQGFAQEYSDRIFEFLKRLHNRDVAGSGIGLSLCKTIIERNGGQIGAEGRLGEGSTFWFTLPAE